MRRPLKAGVERKRHIQLSLDLIDGVHCVAQRSTGRQIERQGDHGKLALMVHGQRRRRLLEMRESAERHLRAVRRIHVDILQRVGILLEARIDFEHDVILVELREHRGHLPLPEGVVEGVVDCWRQDSEPRGRIAIDHQLCVASPDPAGRDATSRNCGCSFRLASISFGAHSESSCASASSIEY